MRWLVLAVMMLAPAAASGAVLAAARTLPAGTVINAADLRAIDGDRAGISDPGAVIGQQLRVTVYEGRPLHPTMLQAPRLITRNQIVRVAFRRGSLSIETEGRALSDGAAGDVIRVMNMGSRATITVQVMPDGSLSVPQ